MFKKYFILTFGLMMTTAFAKPFAYMLNTLSGTVSIIDLTTKQLGKPIPMGENLTSIAIHNDYAYVTSNGNKVFIIDLTTNKIVGEPILVGKRPNSIVIYDPDAKSNAEKQRLGQKFLTHQQKKNFTDMTIRTQSTDTPDSDDKEEIK